MKELRGVPLSIWLLGALVAVAPMIDFDIEQFLHDHRKAIPWVLGLVLVVGIMGMIEQRLFPRSKSLLDD